MLKYRTIEIITRTPNRLYLWMYFTSIMTICLEILFSTTNIQCPLSNRILVQDVLISVSFSILGSHFSPKWIPIVSVKDNKLKVEPVPSKPNCWGNTFNISQNIHMHGTKHFHPTCRKAQSKILQGWKKLQSSLICYCYICLLTKEIQKQNK